MPQSRKLQNTLIAALQALLAQRLDSNDDLMNDEDIASLIRDLESGPDHAIQVVLSGGLLRSASSDHPLATLFAVETLDFDTDGSDDLDCLATPSEAISYESPAGAFVNSEPVNAGKLYSLEDWPG